MIATQCVVIFVNDLAHESQQLSDHDKCSLMLFIHVTSASI